MRILRTIALLFLLVTVYILHPHMFPASAADPITGYRFAFINNPRRELTEEESQYIAHHYDLAVIGYQSDPMIASAQRIKAINPSITLLLYFPTSVRQDGAHYGQNEFKEAWYLHDKAGNRIYKTQTLAFIDLTNEEYREWARTTLISFLNRASFDGALFDNANPLGVEGNTTMWEDRIGSAKLDAWNKARVQYITQINNILNNRGKILIFNGIHRALSKINRSTGTLGFTDGALNEGFCYGQNNSGTLELVSKELQLEDIDLQQSIGMQQKYVLQKVNFTGFMSFTKVKQQQLGNFCYGVFLMGHVPNFTFFKFGEGYNLYAIPEEYRINAETIDLQLGNPVGKYQKNNWLLTRRFQHGYVVVNLNTSSAIWTAPAALQQYQDPSNNKPVAANQIVSIAPESAAYFLFPASSPTLPPSTTNSADLTDEGDTSGNHVNEFDYNVLVGDFGKTGTPGWIKADIIQNGKVDEFDYNALAEDFGK